MIKLSEILGEEWENNKDLEAANKIRPELNKSLKDLEDLIFKINKNVSSFMAPGLREAFTNSILAGLKVQRTAFVSGKAIRVLDKYFKR
ncbi:hypothetical protein HOK09_04000 [Candidatus Woesearchaeota archaeon]|jgi:hypothetical protein|nr:hypothetical protein [Candidatus Woesearchaeota archaeon]